MSYLSDIIKQDIVPLTSSDVIDIVSTKSTGIDTINNLASSTYQLGTIGVIESSKYKTSRNKQDILKYIEQVVGHVTDNVLPAYDIENDILQLTRYRNQLDSFVTKAIVNEHNMDNLTTVPVYFYNTKHIIAQIYGLMSLLDTWALDDTVVLGHTIRNGRYVPTGRLDQLKQIYYFQDNTLDDLVVITNKLADLCCSLEIRLYQTADVRSTLTATIDRMNNLTNVDLRPSNIDTFVQGINSTIQENTFKLNTIQFVKTQVTQYTALVTDVWVKVLNQ